jgi:hypothetical protein
VTDDLHPLAAAVEVIDHVVDEPVEALFGRNRRGMHCAQLVPHRGDAAHERLA